jgi:hypothetical protein
MPGSPKVAVAVALTSAIAALARLAATKGIARIVR